jgi:putative ABC transport system substrate-binding protein
MRRREFIFLTGGTAVAWPFTVFAQQATMPTIGYLSLGSAETTAAVMVAFRKGLSETAFVEGKNVAIEYRLANGASDRLPALAHDLIDRKVAVILAASLPASLAAKAVTNATPIVFVTGADPVQLGLVASLNRPGRNLTGIAQLSVALEPKKLQLLRELVPGAAAIAMLVNPATPNPEILRGTQEAARALGQQLLAFEASTASEIDTAFTTLVQQKADALIVAADSYFNSRRDQIIALAARFAVPTIYFQREFVVEGGLISYGVDYADSFREAGVYVGRILNGEKPSELPVVQSTKIELIVNVKTATALGLTLPLSVLARANEVIE